MYCVNTSTQNSCYAPINLCSIYRCFRSSPVCSFIWLNYYGYTWYSTVLNKPARAPALTHTLQHVLLMFTCCRYTCMVGHLTAPCLSLSLSYTCHSLVTRSSATASHFVYVNPYKTRIPVCCSSATASVYCACYCVCVVSYNHYQFVLRG